MVSEITTGKNLEITAISDSLWKARVIFLSEDVTDREMITRMREVKKAIAAQFTVPVELLEFREVLERERRREGVAFSVSIGRIAVGKGKATLRLLPLNAPNGEVYSDMLAEVDFYYLDEFDQKITLERLMETFQRWGLNRELINIEAINKAVQYVLENRSLVTHLEVARGVFPDKGQDAELEYTFFTEPGAAGSIGEYRSSRKVKEGDILCQKIPSRDGKQTGRGVLGQVIPPRKGLDFKLLPGEGSKLSLDGTRITATRDGLAVMTRTVRKIYTAAGKKIVPSQIEVSVKSVTSVRGSQTLNLAVDNSLEITGSLPKGSSVRSTGEVFVVGDIEPGAIVSASQNVIVEGQICGQVASDASVLGRQGAKNAQIKAREAVELAGVAENSDILAETVKVLESVGSRIMASYKVQIDCAKSDPSGRRTTIRVGRKTYYADMLKSSEEGVKNLLGSLGKLKEFFGNDIVQRAGQEHMQRLFLEQLETLNASGQKKLTHEQVQSVKTLLESIRPLTNVLDDKREEITSLRKKASDEEEDKPIVVIREKIQDPVEVSFNETTKTLEPSDTGMIISTTDEGGLTTQSLSGEEGR